MNGKTSLGFLGENRNSRQQKKIINNTDDEQIENTIKYLKDENDKSEMDMYFLCSNNLLTEVKNSINYFSNTNKINNVVKDKDNQDIEYLINNLYLHKKKNKKLKERLEFISNKTKKDKNDLILMENNLRILEKDNQKIKEKIKFFQNSSINNDEANKTLVHSNIKEIASKELTRMKSLLVSLSHRTNRNNIRSPRKTLSSHQKKMEHDFDINNQPISSCKNSNSSKYYLNLPNNSPHEGEKMLFNVRIRKKSSNGSLLNSVSVKHNSMSFLGSKNVNNTKLKYSNLLKSKQNITSSTCSTLRKSVI